MEIKEVVTREKKDGVRVGPLEELLYFPILSVPPPLNVNNWGDALGSADPGDPPRQGRDKHPYFQGLYHLGRVGLQAANFPKGGPMLHRSACNQKRDQLPGPVGRTPCYAACRNRCEWTTRSIVVEIDEVRGWAACCRSRERRGKRPPSMLLACQSACMSE